MKNIKAIITGGASGLGESVVRKVVQDGGKAAILDLNEEQGNALAGELGEAAIFCKTDVSSEEDVQNAINAAVEKFGTINVVVNAAGIIAAGKTVGKKGAFDLEVFKKVIKCCLVITNNRVLTTGMSTNKIFTTSTT